MGKSLFSLKGHVFYEAGVFYNLKESNCRYVSAYTCRCCCLFAKLCLFDPMDCSPPGSSTHSISQTRILEQVAISFSRGSSQFWDWICTSCLSRQILYDWAPREAQYVVYYLLSGQGPGFSLFLSLFLLSCYWYFRVSVHREWPPIAHPAGAHFPPASIPKQICSLFSHRTERACPEHGRVLHTLLSKKTCWSSSELEV